MPWLRFGGYGLASTSAPCSSRRSNRWTLANLGTPRTRAILALLLD